MSGATVGPADGIIYTVLGSREVTRPAIECGFNDIGAGNPGVFSVENRAYSEYLHGTILRSWSEDVETFLRCAG